VPEEGERLWRPRTKLQPEMDRWVLRAALRVGLDLSADDRERIADAAEEAACRTIVEALNETLERERLVAESLDAQIESERIARERHHYELVQRREMLRHDREHGLG
jgi:arginyl-tRNA--protein-N-Asp/Glu arginylyltransferase